MGSSFFRARETRSDVVFNETYEKSLRSYPRARTDLSGNIYIGCAATAKRETLFFVVLSRALALTHALALRAR